VASCQGTKISTINSTRHDWELIARTNSVDKKFKWKGYKKRLQKPLVRNIRKGIRPGATRLPQKTPILSQGKNAIGEEIGGAILRISGNRGD